MEAKTSKGKTRARKPKTPDTVKSFLRAMAVISSLLTGFAVKFGLDYFSGFVFLFYFSLILLAADLFYENRPKGIRAGIIASAFALIALVFTFAFVRITTSLEVSAFSSAAQYPSGTIIGGISWNSRFHDLRVRIANPTSYDYEAVDIVVRPDEPVAQVGQIGTYPSVSFLDAYKTSVHMEMTEGPTKREVMSVVSIASNGGYRVHCEKLPSKMSIEIVMAIVSVSTSERILKVKIPDGQNIWSHWFDNKSYMPNDTTDVYGSPPTPSMIYVDGQYTVLLRRRTVKETLKVEDLIGQFLNRDPAQK